MEDGQRGHHYLGVLRSRGLCKKWWARLREALAENIESALCLRSWNLGQAAFLAKPALCFNGARYLHAISDSLQNGPEVGPLFGDGVPALRHESVNRTRTVERGLEPAAVGHELHHLLVAPAGVGHVAERHHFPQEDPK